MFFCLALVPWLCPLERHGKGLNFECRGCWPCRTTMTTRSLSATLSRLTLRLQTSCEWHVLIPAISLPFCFFCRCFCLKTRCWQDYLKKVQTSNRISFILFWNKFQKGTDKDRASASTTFAVSSWFCVSCPMLCLGQRWVQDKADSDAPEHGFAVRRSRRRWNCPSQLPWLKSFANRTSRCLCHQLLFCSSIPFCVRFFPQIAGSYRGSYFSMTGSLIFEIAAWSPFPLRTCLPSLSPFMLPLRLASVVPLPPCLPTLSPFLISVFACS